METLGDRLKFFIDRNYKSQSQFGDETKINKDVINRYVMNKAIPGGDILFRMGLAGLSIDWLLFGTGSMYSNTTIGRQLFSKDINASTSTEKPFDRIKTWIVDNYKSIEQFAILNNIDFLFLMEKLNEHSILDPKLLMLLKEVGCNLEWIMWNTGYSAVIKSEREGQDKDAMFNKEFKKEVLSKKSPEERQDDVSKITVKPVST